MAEDDKRNQELFPWQTGSDPLAFHRLLRFLLRRGGTAFGVVILVTVCLWIGFGILGIVGEHSFTESSVCDEEFGTWVSYYASRVGEVALKLLIMPLQPNAEQASAAHWGPSQYARLFGAIAAAFLAVGFLVRWLSEALQRWISTHLVGGHIVLIGVGGAGFALLQDLLSGASNRLVVGIDPDREKIEKARTGMPGALLIHGDAKDPEAWRALAIHRAKYVFISTGDDARNIEIAGRVRAHHGRHPRSRSRLLEVAPLVTDRTLHQRVEPILNKVYRQDRGRGKCRILAFHPADVAARQLLERHPFDTFARLTPSDHAHILLVGMSNLGEMLLLRVLQATLRPDLDPPHVTVLARDAEVVRDRLHRLYPELDTGRDDSVLAKMGIRIEFHEFDGDPTKIRDVLKEKLQEDPQGPLQALSSWVDAASGSAPPDFPDVQPRWPGNPVTSIVIAWGDDSANLNLAFALQRGTTAARCWQAPTFLRLRNDSGLEESLALADREFDLHEVIDSFGRDDDVCTFREIFERPAAKFVKILHGDYLEVRKDQNREVEPGRTEAGGAPDAEDLSGTFERANRYQSDCIAVKLRALGYRLVRGSTPPDALPIAVLPDPTAIEDLEPMREALAVNEHDRWIVERACDGWQRGPERDNELKIHPNMVSWEELAQLKEGYDARAFDRKHIKKLGELAKYAALPLSTPGRPAVWRRDLVIGLVGPELDPNDSLEAPEELLQALRKEFKKLRKQINPASPAVTLLIPDTSEVSRLFLTAGGEVFRDNGLRILCCLPFPISTDAKKAAAECLKRDAESEKSKKDDAESGKAAGEPGKDTAESEKASDKPGKDSTVSAKAGEKAKKESAKPPKPEVLRALAYTKIRQLIIDSPADNHDSWMIDLFPPCLPYLAVMDPPESSPPHPILPSVGHIRSRLRASQPLRTAAYVVERSDHLFRVSIEGTSPRLPCRADHWWTGLETFPEQFRTNPLSRFVRPPHDRARALHRIHIARQRGSESTGP